jgi:release factor glutamine methyltransferase
MLIQQIRQYGSDIRGKNALEIGCGGGVVLAALAREGAKRVCGVDIEADAITASSKTLNDVGYLDIAELHQGDMWAAIPDRIFDVVVANLPQAPLEKPTLDGRRLTWNFGGLNGRLLLDQFLHGVGAHLAADGWGLITHFDPIDVDKTLEILNAAGFKASVVMTRLLTYSEERLNNLVPHVVASKIGKSIISYGEYVFSEVHIVEFRRARSTLE